MTLAEKLERYSMPEPNSGCQLWLAHTVWGYGHVYWKDRDYRAHRLAWELANGPIPKGMVVCHRCDVKACINPAHLFVDTVLGNNEDKRRKGRQAKGEKVNTARFTAEQVRKIRKDNRRTDEIASEYGVALSSIVRIRNGRNWKHIL